MAAEHIIATLIHNLQLAFLPYQLQFLHIQIFQQKLKMPPTISKFRQVQQEPDQLKANEIRVSTKGSEGFLINRALDMLTGSGEVAKQESVILRGIENAIPKVLLVAEIVRRRVKGLHQVNAITSLTITERFEPLEEGLLSIVSEKNMPLLTVTLLFSPSETDKKQPGYLEPLPETEIQERKQRSGDDRPRRGGREGGQRYDRDHEGGQRYDRDREGGQRYDRDREGGQRYDRNREGGQRYDRDGDDRRDRGDRQYRGGRGGDRQDRGDGYSRGRGDRGDRGEGRNQRRNNDE